MSRRSRLREEYKIMPDEELREIFRESKRVRRMLGIPLFLIFYMIGFSVVNFINVFREAATEDFPYLSFLAIVSYAVAFVGMSFIFSEKTGAHIRCTAVSLLVMAALAGANLMLGTDVSLLIIQGGLFAGILLLNVLAHGFIRDLELLKAHPRFPFDNWRKDEAVLLKVTREEAAKVIGNTLDRFNVRSTGHEDLFEGEIRKAEEAKADPQTYMQQRRQIWHPQEKEDTAYTLDNINRMYIDDGMENGELKGEELEAALKAAVPEKPTAEKPEDFLQQSDTVWRSSRHDSGSREAPQVRKDDVRERSVLM